MNITSENNDRPKVFTYYEDCDVWRHEAKEILDAWVTNWISRGFEPIILSHWDVAASALLPPLMAHCKSLPTRNPRDYELACYKRWVAMYHIGGGMMVDWDLFNLNFTATDYEMVKLMKEMESEPDAPVFLDRHRVPCAVIGNRKAYKTVYDWIMGYQSNGRHTSDMNICIERAQGLVVDMVGEVDRNDNKLAHFSFRACNGSKIKAIDDYRSRGLL